MISEKIPVKRKKPTPGEMIVSYLSEFLFFCVVVGMCVLVIYLGYLFFVTGENPSPHYGVVVGMYHNKTGYYLHYSDSGQLWKDKVSYASYITCHKGSVWDGVFQLVCTKNGVFK